MKYPILILIILCFSMILSAEKKEAEPEAGPEKKAEMKAETKPAAKAEAEKKAEPEKNWPACYDQPCKKSKECCDGTKCLPWMAKMHPKIKETGYCVIKDCKEGDDSTCPPGHTCLKSMMGSYCIKKK